MITICPNSAPGRCALGIITMLAVGGFLTGQQRPYPVVSYVTSADLYVMVCYVFVFCALLEYAVVHYFFVYEKQIHQFQLQQQMVSHAMLFLLILFSVPLKELSRPLKDHFPSLFRYQRRLHPRRPSSLCISKEARMAWCVSASASHCYGPGSDPGSNWGFFGVPALIRVS
ncbi:glycine receptor subunit alpha-1 isoform X2 [Nematostella vectensis]|uniref:glycine receptor subunit alpha-1 isoform X2 n=1 Tax=Nematostella vectensis TaxID=45351 RepID=UPI0020773064|nr:glycine receptor subunit alpha-1 isoform X2 [Nematostella vectensis]